MNTTMPETFQPTTVVVDINTLRQAVDACKVGKQFASETLTEHDRSLGRTTLKNLRWALSLEKDIQKFTEIQAVLEKLVGDH